MNGAVLVAGTSSSAGKSTIVAGLCRVFARKGIDVAPFKALNMSNNAVVADDGGEIARAQHAQALAAGVAPVTAMGPVLVKPIDDRRSQVIVRGRPAAPGCDLFGAALDAFAEVRSAHDLVIAEGAGGAAEVNLLDRDIANLPLAYALGIPALLVADIDRGGAIASVVGTHALLPPQLRAPLRGVVVNKFRGDRALLEPALATITERTGLPVLGVVRWLDGLVDSEDSLDLDAVETRTGGGPVDVAVITYPHVSNWSDIAPFSHDPAVTLRLVRAPAALGDPDLVVLPGSRSVAADLGWLRDRRLDRALASSRATVLGICGGYEMLGASIADPLGIEQHGIVAGLGWLPVSTSFEPGKVTRRATVEAFGHAIAGYEIRHGRVTVPAGVDEWIAGGARAGRFLGTTWHGLFEHDGFRRAFLEFVAPGRALPPAIRWVDVVRRAHDRVADAIEADVDVARVADIASAR